MLDDFVSKPASPPYSNLKQLGRVPKSKCHELLSCPGAQATLARPKPLHSVPRKGLNCFEELVLPDPNDPYTLRLLHCNFCKEINSDVDIIDSSAQ